MKLMCAAVCLCFAAVPALAAEGRTSLTLAEAVKSAVEKNLDVRAELYNPAMAQADIRKNEGIYDTTLKLDTDFNYSVTEPSSQFTTGSPTNRIRTFTLNPGATQLVPTGGTVGITFNNSYNHNNFKSATSLNEYWESDVTLNLIQPLLKNFGREPTELAIMVARNSKGESLERFRSTLSDTVLRVRTEYFKLYSLRQELEVKKASLLLARKILDDTKARVNAGVLPAMEILNAEFGVASREKDLIDAEKAVQDQNDVLRVLLQYPGRDEIIPSDVPTKDPLTVNSEEMVKLSLDNRPEIKEQRTALKSRELEMRVARNRTLPDLNLSASAALTGLDRQYSRDLEKVGSTDYPVWGVGLHFTYPLGNNAAENEYIKSKLRLEQARTQLHSLEVNVENDVKAAIRGVESGYKQLEVTDRGRAFAEERLRSFIKKNEVGLATTKDVLDVENDLAEAKSNQIKALVGYSDAITQLWRTTGEILDRTGVHLSGMEGDSLYELHARD